MSTNNSSDKNEDVSESRNLNDPENVDQNRMPGSSQTSAAGNSGVHRSNKGTGMSSEAGSDQSEQSWQDTGGSQQGSAQKNSGNNNNNNEQLRGSGNMSRPGSGQYMSGEDYSGDSNSNAGQHSSMSNMQNEDMDEMNNEHDKNKDWNKGSSVK
jgi:hypothetical protein